MERRDEELDLAAVEHELESVLCAGCARLVR
jgi:hypothetical protein